MGNTKHNKEQEDLIFTFSGLGGFQDLKNKTRCFEAFKMTEKDFSALNTHRGGECTARNSGFVFEYLDAADFTATNGVDGKIRNVINNNGIADSMTIDKYGNITYQQVKRYPSDTGSAANADWGKYKDQTFVLPNGERKSIDFLQKKGLPVEESGVSVKLSDAITNARKLEAKIRGTDHAPITSTLTIAAYQLKAANKFAVNAGKSTATFTAGMSFGKNMYELMEDNISLQELIIQTACDSAVSFGGAYASSMANYYVTGMLSQSAIVTQTASLLVSTSAGSTIVTVGNAIATMSAALGPVFLLGMAVGAGYATIDILKRSSDQYRHKLVQINAIINEAVKSMEQAQQELKELIDDTFTIWDQTFESGFNQIHTAILNNSFDQLSSGLDTILSIFNEQVAFKTMEEFDQFFFDENAVFTL